LFQGFIKTPDIPYKDFHIPSVGENPLSSPTPWSEPFT